MQIGFIIFKEIKRISENRELTFLPKVVGINGYFLKILISRKCIENKIAVFCLGGRGIFMNKTELEYRISQN